MGNAKNGYYLLLPRSLLENEHYYEEDHYTKLLMNAASAKQKSSKTFYDLPNLTFDDAECSFDFFFSRNKKGHEEHNVALREQQKVMDYLWLGCVFGIVSFVLIKSKD